MNFIKTNSSLVKKLAMVAIFAFIMLFYGCTKTIAVEELKVDKTKVTIAIGEEAIVTVTVLPDNATDKTIKWSSDDPAIAEVTDGTIKGIAKGDTTIRVTAGEKTVTIEVTVNDPQVTVTFDTNGGSTVPSQKLLKGGKATKPTAPTRTGYNFVGWYKANLTDEFDFLSPIEEDVTIYAKWEALSFTVNFQVGDAIFYNEEVKYDNKVSKPIDPVKTGYEFIGWYEEDADVAFDFNIAITKDVILVARFERNANTPYQFEYELNGGNFTYESKAALIDDLLKDYSKATNKEETREKIAGYGNWSYIDFHNFFFNAEYRDKWLWLPAYLGVVGSTTNKKACADVVTAKSVSAYTAINSNHVYALTYEVRAFILDTKYTKNASWMSADYSDFELGNGFWSTFVEYNETTKYQALTDPFTLTTQVYREGYSFAGWYTNPQFKGKPVTTVNGDVKVYAKWEPINPVTEIKIKNTTTTINKLSTVQLNYEVLPANAFNKRVEFITSDEKILKVSSTGLVTACNAGVATITIRSVANGVEATITFTVNPNDDIHVEYASGFNGTLYPNDETQITVNGVGKYKDSLITYQSSDSNILTIDSEGKIKALKKGEATIEVKVDSTSLLTITIPVIDKPTSERIDQLLDLLIKANRPVVDTLNISLYYDNYSAFQQYYKSTYGSVNYFLFDKLNLDATTYLIDPKVQTNKHSGIKTSTEFITIHDTANLDGGLTNHGSYWKQTSHTTSIHFTVGDKGVIQDLDTSYAAHHAGDGTGTKFTWNDTGVKATGTSRPVFDIDSEGYFTVNGVKSSVKAPTGNGKILDSSYFTNLGPTWKIGENGNYYLGTLWFTTSQVARGVISSFGGNLNSTGIEMCVNKDGNMYDTWQRTAKLVGKLLIEHKLDTNRVVQHNSFNGKNCPQSLIMTNYWDEFMKMVELEYLIQTQFSDAIITMVSNNPELVDNTGLVIGRPNTTKTVTYNITVKIGSVTKTVKLSSVVPGISTWSQLDGFYSTIVK